MLANALQPQGVHPRNLHAPQDHPYFLECLQEILQETRQEGRCLWDITSGPTPRTHTPSPPFATLRHPSRRRTDTGSTRSTPGAPRGTQHDAPDPPGQRRHHLTPLPSQPPPQGATPSPVQKTPSEPEADGHQCARQRAALRPTAPNRSSQPSKLPNPPQPPNPSQSFSTSRTRAAPRNF